MTSNPATPRDSARRRLRRSSGAYMALAQTPKVHYPHQVMPLQTPVFTDRWNALAEGVAALDANMAGLSQLHAALNDGFNESFASFLYGLLITMFCNNLPGCPTRDLYEQAGSTALLSVAVLQERIRVAKLRNAQLKAQANAQPRPNQERAIFAHPRSIRGTEQKPRFAVARDDTFLTSDSFVDAPSARTRIPAPGGRPQTGSGTPPNLNQPPRYMRGLFERPGAANTRRPAPKNPVRQTARTTPARGSAAQRAQRERASRLAGRPPFR